MSMDRNNEEEQKHFIEACRPLMKWLSENCHPHVKVIVTSNHAELLSGEMTTGEINDYLKD